MSTLQELLAQKAALDKQITEMQTGARADAIGKIKSLMAEYGLTVDDIAAAGRKPSGAKVPSEGRAKVAAKYRDAATGQEWSGRGLKPRWLTAAINSGKSLEDFAV